MKRHYFLATLYCIDNPKNCIRYRDIGICVNDNGSATNCLLVFTEKCCPDFKDKT